MEINEETQQKKETVKGRLGADVEVKPVQMKNLEIKKVATFSVATTVNNETVWQNVQMWEDKFPPNVNDLKKGDSVELQGYFKPYKDKHGKEQKEFITTTFVGHQPKVANENLVTFKGNLGGDPQIKTLEGGRQVANFSIGIKANQEEVKWQNSQVWEGKIDKLKINELKKGDFIEIKGTFAKEYPNSKGETVKDVIVQELKVLKTALELNEKKNSGLKM
jgi:single-stranded DNA-binding protein